MRNLIIFSSVLLAACGGVSEDNFGEKYFEAYCGAGCTADLSAVCDATTDGSGTDGESTCEFDKAAAKACVDVANWTCDPLIEGSEDTYPTPPADCANVCG